MIFRNKIEGREEGSSFSTCAPRGFCVDDDKTRRDTFCSARSVSVSERLRSVSDIRERKQRLLLFLPQRLTRPAFPPCVCVCAGRVFVYQIVFVLAGRSNHSVTHVN